MLKTGNNPLKIKFYYSFNLLCNFLIKRIKITFHFLICIYKQFFLEK